MAYFLILPLWLAMEAGLAALWLSARHDPQRRLWSLYVRCVLIGSTLGFVLANVGFATSAGWAMAEGSGAHAPLAIAGWLLFGPVVCSALGFTGGTLAGILRAGRLARAGEARIENDGDEVLG